MKKLLMLVVMGIVALFYTSVNADIIHYNYSGYLVPEGGAAWVNGLPDQAPFIGTFYYDDSIPTPPTSGWSDPDYVILGLTFTPLFPSAAGPLTYDELTPEDSGPCAFNPTSGDFIVNINLPSQAYALGLDMATPNGFYSSSAEFGSVYVTDKSPVPEPATMFLFGLGLLGIARVSRKKK